MSFENKYLKYKTKYLELKNKIGGAGRTIADMPIDTNIYSFEFLKLVELDNFVRCSNRKIKELYMDSNTPLYLEVLHIDSQNTLRILAEYPDNKFRIKTLKISINISDNKLMHILLKIRPDSLTNIDLTGCSKITNDGLFHLKRNLFN